MLLGYSPPPVTAAALSGAAGSGWLIADGAAACYDGNPARKARLQWAAAGAPTIADYVQVDLTIASTSLRVCAILGLANVPAGAVVRVYGKRPADGSVSWDFGGQNEATVVQFADGTFGAWFVLPDGAAAVTKVGFRFYNNVAGATWATAATTIDIGELAAMPAVELLHTADFSEETIDPSTAGRTRASQVYVAVRTPYRHLQAGLSADGVASVRGGGLANGMDWQKLRARLVGQARSAVILRPETTAELNATAIYGVARLGQAQHLGGDYYGGSVDVQEVPAI